MSTNHQTAMKSREHMILTMLLAMIFIAPAFAQQVSEEQAELIAKNFFYERSQSTDNKANDEIGIVESFTLRESGKEVMYIFNMEEGGYVMVSAHRSTLPVLGFSLQGRYSGLNPPPQMLDYLATVSKQIHHNIENSVQEQETTVEDWERLLSDDVKELVVFNGRSVEPLLTTTWGQGIYYNEMCPEDPLGPGGHCVTGCVATTLAQLTSYFRFPQQGTGSYSYQCPPYGTLSADFGNTTYRWNEMPSYLTSSSPATAEINYHFGVSVDMVYGPNGSGMYNHKAAYTLRTFFNYSPETQYVYRDSTSMDWDSLIITHLDKHIPLYYAGWSVPNINGHAFVCDGYQEPGYYHFNWGWDGSYDGYFYTDNLSPGGNNFNLAQELVINAFPDTVNFPYPYYGSGIDTITTVAGTIDDGSGPVYNYPDNYYYKCLIAPEDSVEFITLEFFRFDTESNDILTVYDGPDTLSPILGTFSGNTIPDNLVSSGDKLLLVFQSNGTVSDSGWTIGYQSEIPVYCSGFTHMTMVADTFSDGSGPRDYHNFTNCIWSIHPEGATEITLTFLEFETEEDMDILKVYDGTTLMAELSGTELPDPLTAYSGSMFLTWSTNATVTAPGWEAYYESDAVSVSEKIAGENIKIFPNPVSNTLYIDYGDMGVTPEVELFSIKGELIQTEFHNNGDGRIELNVSNLVKGFYFLRISDGESVIYAKVLKSVN